MDIMHPMLSPGWHRAFFSTILWLLLFCMTCCKHYALHVISWIAQRLSAFLHGHQPVGTLVLCDMCWTILRWCYIHDSIEVISLFPLAPILWVLSFWHALDIMHTILSPRWHRDHQPCGHHFVWTLVLKDMHWPLFTRDYLQDGIEVISLFPLACHHLSSLEVTCIGYNVPIWAQFAR